MTKKEVSFRFWLNTAYKTYTSIGLLWWLVFAAEFKEQHYFKSWWLGWYHASF